MRRLAGPVLILALSLLVVLGPSIYTLGRSAAPKPQLAEWTVVFRTGERDGSATIKADEVEMVTTGMDACAVFRSGGKVTSVICGVIALGKK